MSSLEVPQNIHKLIDQTTRSFRVTRVVEDELKSDCYLAYLTKKPPTNANILKWYNVVFKNCCKDHMAKIAVRNKYNVTFKTTEEKDIAIECSKSYELSNIHLQLGILKNSFRDDEYLLLTDLVDGNEFHECETLKHLTDKRSAVRRMRIRWKELEVVKELIKI